MSPVTVWLAPLQSLSLKMVMVMSNAFGLSVCRRVEVSRRLDGTADPCCPMVATLARTLERRGWAHITTLDEVVVTGVKGYALWNS